MRLRPNDRLILITFFLLVSPLSLRGASGGGSAEGGKNQGGEASMSVGQSPQDVGAEMAVEYRNKFGELSGIESQIEVKKKALQALLRAKNNPNAGSKERSQLFKKITETHEELKKKVREYNKLRRQIRYNFPDKGKVTDTRYLPMEEPSLSEMEVEMDLDAHLTRFKAKVKKVYEPLLEDQENMKNRSPASEGSAEEGPLPKKRLRLVK